jgi:hypothetical protein
VPARGEDRTPCAGSWCGEFAWEAEAYQRAAPTQPTAGPRRGRPTTGPRRGRPTGFGAARPPRGQASRHGPDPYFVPPTNGVAANRVGRPTSCRLRTGLLRERRGPRLRPSAAGQRAVGRGPRSLFHAQEPRHDRRRGRHLASDPVPVLAWFVGDTTRVGTQRGSGHGAGRARRCRGSARVGRGPVAPGRGNSSAGPRPWSARDKLTIWRVDDLAR